MDNTYRSACEDSKLTEVISINLGVDPLGVCRGSGSLVISITMDVIPHIVMRRGRCTALGVVFNDHQSFVP